MIVCQTLRCVRRWDVEENWSQLRSFTTFTSAETITTTIAIAITASHPPADIPIVAGKLLKN